jgi:hypothetical protein
MAKYEVTKAQMQLQEVSTFFVNNAKMRPIVERAIEIEETDPQKAQNGWELHDVQTDLESIRPLEVQGLLVKVASKGGQCATYLLANREVMKLGLSLRF